MAEKSIIQQIIEAITNLFKPKLSPEERRRQAELEYRALARSFGKYEQELTRTSEKFKRMAIECESKGQHSNALQAARYVRWLNRTCEKVVGISQRFEMVRIMGNVGDIMVKFMDQCSSIGATLTDQIDVTKLASGEMNMRDGLMKLDYLADKLDQVFNDILDIDVSDDSDTLVGATEDDISALNAILAEAGMSTEKPASKPAAKSVEEPAAPVNTQAEQVAALQSQFDKLDVK